MNFEKIINYIDNKYHHKKIVKYLSNYKISKLIDVRSHKGEFLKNFLKSKKIKSVYAFEPQIDIYKILKKDLKKYKNIKKKNISLDSRVGTKKIYINKLSSTSTLSLINNNSLFLKIKKQFSSLHKGYDFDLSHNYLLKNNFILIKKFKFPLMNFEDRFYFNTNYKIQ